MRAILCFLFLLCLGALPTAAQTATPVPLTETFTSEVGEGLRFQYPPGWYVLESLETIVVTDSEETFDQFRVNAQAALQPGMVAISILRPQTLALGFSLSADATLDDFVTLIQPQLRGVEPEPITLGVHSAYRFAFPPQRFETVAFAFESGSLYFASLSVATGTLPTYEPIAQAIFASFTAVERAEPELPEIEIDETLVSELYAPLIAPLTFEYPEGWIISESAFGALQLSNSAVESNVFEPPVAGVVRVQITFTKADELPFIIADAAARAIVEFTASADQAVLPLDAPYSDMTEFRVGGYSAARMDSIGATSQTLLMVVEIEDWFVTIRAVAFGEEMADFEPIIMALAASIILLPEPASTPELTPEAG